MKFSLFTDNGALNSKPIFQAFAQGCGQQGHDVVYNTLEADVAVIWSILWHGRMSPNKKVWDHFKSKGKPIIVLEVGALHRNIMWKVGINGINADAVFGQQENNSDRADQLGLKLKPWKDNSDGHILICTQHDKSEQWKGMPNISNWVLEVIEHIRSQTDRKIIVRPHPRCKLQGIQHEFQNVFLQKPQYIEGTYDDFDLNLENTFAVVNWSSNPAIQSIMSGVPAYVSKHSLSYGVGNPIYSDYNNPLKPDRQQWLNDLAYTEWSVPEISQGIQLKRLTSFL
jgi:hypothetical protein